MKGLNRLLGLGTGAGHRFDDEFGVSEAGFALAGALNYRKCLLCFSVASSLIIFAVAIADFRHTVLCTYGFEKKHVFSTQLQKKHGLNCSAQPVIYLTSFPCRTC